MFVYYYRGSKYLHLSEEEDFDVRLCTADVNGTVCPEKAHQVRTHLSLLFFFLQSLHLDVCSQGFLEIFNRTTMQWVPICDKRFTERNAQVVCRCEAQFKRTAGNFPHVEILR